jgi:glycosyltransferase involved in cell wall biosynthesis
VHALKLRTSDPDEMSCSIVSLLEDPPQRRRLGREARTLVEHRFDWNVSASRLLDIYSDVLKV